MKSALGPSSAAVSEYHLGMALKARGADERARHARAGLSVEGPKDPETEVLLLRQLYTSCLDQRQLRRALEVAQQMVETGALRDIAHHDAARVLFALGRTAEAIDAQRLAARVAPATRRAFHLWSLGTWQAFDGRTDDAVASLERAERWAGRTRPLMRAHRAYVQLAAGEAVPNLGNILGALRRAKCREGYGQFILGMTSHLIGDRQRAAVHLRAFLRRNAAIDAAKEITLREELSRARLTLATLESD